MSSASFFARRRGVAAALALAPFALAGCGGGSDTPSSATPAIAQFSSDRDRYFVGEEAQLTVVYSGGAGRIEPGIGAVPSGATVATRKLDRASRRRCISSAAPRAAAKD